MSIDEGSFTVASVQAKCPKLSAAVNALTSVWLKPALDRLAAIDSDQDVALRSKQLNDPIWHTFEIEDREIVLLDSPLLQRMRGIRQLGLANLVFPSANHDRFEHLCGVIEAADCMFTALERNAERRRDKDKEAGREPPTLRHTERIAVRLAALLHDVGHGPFSHAIEPVVATRYSSELRAFNSYVTKIMHLDSKIEIAELISILIVLSPSMRRIFQHNIYRRPEGCTPQDLQLRIATLIMGARRHDQLACLSAIVSGQVDADKLDYMRRDAHHSGMPIAFDTERLLQKLEIIRCTADSLPSSQSRNIEFAEGSPNKQYFDLGISASGVGALEQMLIGRAFLYDRLYHHHKVRVADAMAQRLLCFVDRARKKRFTLADLYLPVGDDTMIRLLGGQITMKGFQTVAREAKFLADSLLSRNLYVRAFAFRASFHVGLPEVADERERTDALADLWTPVSTDLSDLEGRLRAEEEIIDIARRIGPRMGTARFKALSAKLRREHVIVDLAGNRVKAVTINVHAADGSLEEPNLFFDPARWSQVYDLQKRTGHVFCPREFVPLVALASKLYFFERWGYVASDKADRFSKTTTAVKPKWVSRLRRAGLIDNVTEEAVQRTTTVRTYIRVGDVQLPEPWANEAPDLKREIVERLRDLLPHGISTNDKQAVVATLSALASFSYAMHEDKSWISATGLKERDLQLNLARHLRARSLKVVEGGKLAGGEFDLVVNGSALIENKCVGVVADPFKSKPDAPFQANRYAIAKCQRIFFTVVAYIPRRNSRPPRQTRLIRVRGLEGAERSAVEIRIALPYGLPTPSKVKAPKPKR